VDTAHQSPPSVSSVRPSASTSPTTRPSASTSPTTMRTSASTTMGPAAVRDKVPNDLSIQHPPTLQAPRRNHRHDSPRPRPSPPSTTANSQQLLLLYHPPKALSHHRPPLPNKLQQPLPHPSPEPFFTTTRPRIPCKLRNTYTEPLPPFPLRLSALASLTIELPRHYSPMWIFEGWTFKLTQFRTSHYCRLSPARFLYSQPGIADPTLRGFQNDNTSMLSFLDLPLLPPKPNDVQRRTRRRTHRPRHHDRKTRTRRIHHPLPELRGRVV